MQHEQRIAAEQARGVDPERYVLSHAFLGVGLDRLPRGFIVPLALHGAPCSTLAGETQGVTATLDEDLAMPEKTLFPSRSYTDLQHIGA